MIVSSCVVLADRSHGGNGFTIPSLPSRQRRHKRATDGTFKKILSCIFCRSIVSRKYLNAKSLEEGRQPGTHCNMDGPDSEDLVQPQTGKLLQLLCLFEDNLAPWSFRHEHYFFSREWLPSPLPRSVRTRKLVRSFRSLSPTLRGPWSRGLAQFRQQLIGMEHGSSTGCRHCVHCLVQIFGCEEWNLDRSLIVCSEAA